ncbi:MAG: regulatory protein RecX [bacterium]
MGRGGTITKIETQKHHPHRCSIFIDNGFAFGLDKEIVLKNDLRVGQELDDHQIETLLLNEEEKKAKQYAFNLLSYGDRSCRQLRDRLRGEGYDAEIIDRVVDWLKQVQLLDDERFACQWARDRLRSKPMGAKLLHQKLREKGIEPEIVERTIDNLYGEVSEEELALKLLESRRERYGDLRSEKFKRQMSDFLLRRGFPWETVRETVEKMTSEQT